MAGCAVLPVPDDKWGELVHGVVTFKPGMRVTREELRAHFGELIGNYKLPRTFEFRAALPERGVA